MTMDDWMAAYVPVQNHLDKHASWEGRMFETFGAQLDHVSAVYAKSPLNVWTILESDGMYTVTNGLHHVNRAGYLITEKGAAAGRMYDIVDPDDTVDADEDDE